MNKEEAFDKWIDGRGIFTDNVVHFNHLKYGFEGAYNIQQARIDKLEEALEKIQRVGGCTTISGEACECLEISRESLNKEPV